MFSLKRIISIISSIALAACCVTACDDDEDNGNGSGDGNKTGNSKQTLHVTADETIECEPLQGQTDFSKTGSDIADYLIQHCRLSTYFTQDAFKNSPQKLGSPCYCYGKDCTMAHYERPEQQKIIGCDNVKGIPEAGMVPICLRSTRLELIEPALYFPNGMCALAVSACETIYDPKCEEKGDATCKTAKLDDYDPYICSFAVFGDPTKLSSGTNFNGAEEKIKAIECPDDNVLVRFNMDIKMKANESRATESMLDLVGCFQGCKTDADCRTGEYDFILQEPGKIKCVKADPNEEGVSAGVCFDLDSVEFSNISPNGIKTVKPGKYTWTD